MSISSAVHGISGKTISPNPMKMFHFGCFLVTGPLHSRLNEAVKVLKKPGISTFDVLIKSGHMRMVQHDDGWKLHNTRTKDIELFEAMGFTPDLTYLLLRK